MTSTPSPNGQPQPPASRRPSVRLGLLLVVVALVGLAGYAGYALYPRFDMPATQGAGLVGLAAAGGVASFFSPCSFPLLVALLARGPASGTDRTPPRPLVFGGALAVGAAAFLLLVGAGIAAGGRALFAEVTFTSTAGIALRAVVGTGLVALGLIQTGVVLGRINVADRVLKAPIQRAQARLRRRHPVAGYGAFGFGYVLSGFG